MGQLETGKVLHESSVQGAALGDSQISAFFSVTESTFRTRVKVQSWVKKNTESVNFSVPLPLGTRE